MKPTNTHGGPNRNQGRKSGPNGKRTAKIVVKCLPAEKEAWEKQAELSGMWLSELVRMRMNARMPLD